VIPSGLLIGLLLAAVPLVALGGALPMLPAVGLGVMLALVAAGLIDGVLSRARDSVEVRRGVSEVLSLGARNRVELSVGNRTGRTLRLLVKDDPPVEFDTPRRMHRLVLGPWERRTVGYLTTPRRRGDHEFGDLHLRGLSRLRLAWWQRRIEAPRRVRVYPNLLQLREFDALARRGRLEDLGLRSARSRGEGTEFESLREYLPDDSFRNIDWKATARRGAPITRQYQAERNQTLLLLIDAGRMMASPAAETAADADAAIGGPAEQAPEMTRVDYAINAALMLAHVAGRMGDTVGLLVFSDRVKSFVPPARGGAQAERMLEELYALEAELVEPDYRAAVSFLRARARKRAMICAFTDLVDPEVSARALSYLSSLRPQHLPLVATIRDLEIEALAEAEPAVPAEAYEKAVARRTLGERDLAFARLRSRGVMVCDASPENLAAGVVNRYLSVKRRGLL
jgi:uncharacterized protein (DUF58 family)